MFAFLEKLLPEILGLKNFPGPLVIERAHRISRFSEDRSDSPLKAVTMKFLNYADKIHTLKAARAKCTMRIDKRKLMFFSDMSAGLHKECKRFDEVSFPELRYGILHPATFCVTYKAKCRPPDVQRIQYNLKYNAQQDLKEDISLWDQFCELKQTNWFITDHC